MSRQNNGPFDRAHWWKSSRSGGSGGACLEFTDEGDNGEVGVRDSKNPGGPELAFGRAAWRSFNAAVQAGRFDR